MFTSTVASVAIWSLLLPSSNRTRSRSAQLAGRGRYKELFITASSKQSGLAPDGSRPDNKSPTYCQQSIALL